MQREPVRHPTALERHNRGWIIAFGFLLLGIVIFAISVIFAITGMITCGGGCANKSAFDILFGEVKSFGLFCLGFIMLAIGAVIFGLYKWGLLLDRVPWQELHPRYRYRP